jgi:hypothetical protein
VVASPSYQEIAERGQQHKTVLLKGADGKRYSFKAADLGVVTTLTVWHFACCRPVNICNFVCSDLGSATE